MLTIFEGLISNLIVASLIAMIALVLARFWRNAVLAHVLWLLVLIKLITPPLVPVPCLPDWSVATVELEDGSVTDTVLQPPSEDLQEASSYEETQVSRFAGTIENHPAEPTSEVSGRPTAEADTSIGLIRAQPNYPSWTNVILVIWLVGSVVCVLRSTISITRFFRHLTFAAEAGNKLESRTAALCKSVGQQPIPQVMLLPGAVAPMIWAPFYKSYLLLPKNLIADINSKKLDALITHEIGHLYLRHHWVRRFELLVTVIFWWCPLVWLAKRKLREYEEEICDAWVVQTIPGIEEAYAHALVDTVKFLSRPQFQLPPAAVGNNHFHFLNRRITMIMQNESQFKLSLSGWLVAIAVMLMGLPFAPTAVEAAAAISSNSTAANIVGTVSQPDDDRDDDWDDEDGRDEDDDWDEDDRDPLEEIIEEITEGLAEMNEEILEAIEEAREELHEEISEAPEEVLVALSEIDLDDVVEDALNDAPKMVHLFVDEVDPAGVIARITEDIDIDAEMNEEVLDRVRTEITNEISSHIAQLSRHSTKQVKDVRRQIKQGIAEVPPEVRQRIVEADLPRMVDRLTKNSHSVVKQFVKEVQLGDTIKSAMRSAGDARYRARDAESSARQSVRHRRNRRVESKAVTRDELEQKLADLMDQVEMIRRELRELDKRDR